MESRNIQRHRLRRKSSHQIKLAALSSIQAATDDMHELIGIDNSTTAQSNRYWYKLALRSSQPDTPLNEIVRRSAFMLMSSLTCIAGIVWGVMYIYLNEPNAAIYPFTYSILMTTCFLFMTKEGRYHDLVFMQLLLILILPICLQIEVGGTIKAGAVIIWSFLCPLGAALFSQPSTAKRWFVIYILSVLGTLYLEYINFGNKFHPHHNNNNNHHHELSPIQFGLFVMNICGAMTITFSGALLFSIRLDSEYKRSEKLLQNVLPTSIAKRLKDGESHIIEHFDGVSILFADLVGFTAAAAEFKPQFLIGQFLSDVFSTWDKLSDLRSMEKIKTIGDAFMVVGGIETKADCRSASEIAVEMVMLALEMQQALDEINKKYELNFKVRVGLHSGPVIAGVIGLKKFAFDVWGDAVNIASRMESQGVPGCLHISSDAYEKVKRYLSHFEIQCRGTVDVKGKGTMTTYVLDMSSIIKDDKTWGRSDSVPSEVSELYLSSS